jgi:DNA-binding NtrC family response regulator
MRIAVVEDDAGVRGLIVRVLAEPGNDLVAFSSGTAFLESDGAARFDVVVSDLKMDGASGLDVLRACRVAPHPPEVLLVTGHAEVRGAVEAMRLGALDYLAKPLDPSELRRRVEQAGLARRRRDESQALAADGARPPDLVAESPAMRDLRARAERAAAISAPVLILGETGTGKELIARHLHAAGARSAHAFRTIDCESLPDDRFESALFGGSADAGALAEARGGTLFLAEVGALSLRPQAVLARAVEDRDAAPGDVRLIASSRRDLASAVATGAFRRDLYDRLSVLTLVVPPLRLRREDLAPLAGRFLAEASRGLGRVLTFAEGALERLRGRAFPGNVRELRSAIERAALLSEDGRLQPEDFSFPPDATAPARWARGRISRERLARTLAEHGNNRVRAARALGISRATLYRLLANVGSDEPVR